MPTPTVDPHPLLIAARHHATAMRPHLDRLDATLSDYTGPGRDRLLAAVLAVRVALDEVDARLEAEVAGL